jgi:hypothetical protein
MDVLLDDTRVGDYFQEPNHEKKLINSRFSVNHRIQTRDIISL